MSQSHPYRVGHIPSDQGAHQNSESPQREDCMHGSHIMNLAHFVAKLKTIRIPDSSLLVSFNVKSLFKKVLIPEVILAIRDKSIKDDTLDERKGMTPPTVCCLVELCMKYTYFEFDQDPYKQTEGASMGSPLFPALRR